MEELRIQGYMENAAWYKRDGHCYIVTRTRPTSLLLRCADKGCPARWLNRFRDEGLGVVAPEHNHEPILWLEERNIMFNRLKERSRNDVIPLNIIYEQEAARHRVAAPHLLFENVVSTMRIWRKSVQPAVPQSLAAYATSLREYQRFSRLLLGTVAVDNGRSTAVILGMDQFGECLRDATVIIADGTFASVPAGLPAYQLLTLHSVIQSHNFHPVVALMSNRTRALYDEVLQFIWRAAGQPQNDIFVADYEPALQGALQTLNNARMQGCFFHYTQALVRNARRRRIALRRASPGWQLVRLYVALALLPAAQVPLALAEIPHIARANNLPYSEAFAEYFQAFWMARVGAEVFSVHGSVHRTSNVAESFHAALRRHPGPNPNIWTFTGALDAKFAVSSSRYTALRNGESLARRNRQGFSVRYRELREREAALNNGQLTIREFLVAASNLVDDGAIVQVPEIGEEVVIGDDHEDGFLVEIPVDNHHALAAPAHAVALQAPDIAPQVLEIEIAPQVLEIAPQVLEIHAPQAQVLPAAGEIICRICFTNVPEYVFVPCGHVVCTTCLQALNGIDGRRICSFCRSAYQQAMRLFL